MTLLRRVPFAVPLRVPVMGVTQRTGWLLQGEDGWAEVSPLPSWSAAERDAAEGAASDWLGRLHTLGPERVAVNAMVPRVAPEIAAQLALASGCTSIKVKVGDRDGVDRVAAVRTALGAAACLRVDANGAWDIDSALIELGRLAVYGIELAEDPVASMADLAVLRRRSPIPVAAEMCVRTPADAARLHDLDAADAVVLKPQRIGGYQATLDAAGAARVPAIASSALETSVGLALVVACAAALGDPFAHGAGTALLLERDVTTSPLLPDHGHVTLRGIVPDLLLDAARTDA
ncbi:MAG: enolase C-terminal domain-like protein [Candidatus Dormibacteria bacterium]